MKLKTTKQAAPAMALNAVANLKTKAIILAMAISLIAAAITAHGAETKTIATSRQPEMSEAQRRATLAEHDRRKAEFARRCAPGIPNPSELETCKVLYRQLYQPVSEKAP